MAAKKINLSINQEELSVINSALKIAERQWKSGFSIMKSSEWISLEFELAANYENAISISEEVRTKLEKIYKEHYKKNGPKKTRQ